MHQLLADVFNNPDLSFFQGTQGFLIFFPVIVLLFAGLFAGALFALYLIVESSVWVSGTRFYRRLTSNRLKPWASRPDSAKNPRSKLER